MTANPPTRKDPKKKTRPNVVTIHLTAEETRTIGRLAHEDDRSESKFVLRELVKAGILPARPGFDCNGQPPENFEL